MDNHYLSGICQDFKVSLNQTCVESLVYVMLAYTKLFMRAALVPGFLLKCSSVRQADCSL